MNRADTVTLVLVRHCESAGNIKQVFQGWVDTGITPAGQRQLQFLSERMAGMQLDAIYASPLKRAQATAQAVNRGHELPIQLDDRLKEIHLGIFENQPIASFAILSREQEENWRCAPHLFAAPQGESMVQVRERAVSFLQEVAKKWKGKTVAVCSHGCWTRNALCVLKGWSIEQLNDVEWSTNTAITIARWSGTGAAEFLVENDASHLPKDLDGMQKQAWWRKENRIKQSDFLVEGEKV